MDVSERWLLTCGRVCLPWSDGLKLLRDVEKLVSPWWRVSPTPYTTWYELICRYNARRTFSCMRPFVQPTACTWTLAVPWRSWRPYALHLYLRANRAPLSGCQPCTSVWRADRAPYVLRAHRAPYERTSCARVTTEETEDVLVYASLSTRIYPWLLSMSYCMVVHYFSYLNFS